MQCVGTVLNSTKCGLSIPRVVNLPRSLYNIPISQKVLLTLPVGFNCMQGYHSLEDNRHQNLYNMVHLLHTIVDYCRSDHYLLTVIMHVSTSLRHSVCYL